MVLRYYPALIVQDEGEGPDAGYGVVFPDLPGCTSSGDTVQEAGLNAAEALGGHIDVTIRAGEDIPPPSPPGAPLPDWLQVAPGKIVTHVLVPVEMPGRSVRTNITLDEGLLSRLDAAATAEGMSRSGFIAQAVRDRLREPAD